MCEDLRGAKLVGVVGDQVALVSRDLEIGLGILASVVIVGGNMAKSHLMTYHVTSSCHYA